MPKVNFIIAGVQKAGTTALYEHLTEIPGITLSTVKEVHFFDNEAMDWSNPDYGSYHAMFPPGADGVVGEATPIYLYWPHSLARIRAYNRDMRLIILLRDPVERAWSHWRMETARGVEQHPFGWCVRQGRERMQPLGFHRELSYVERGFYGAQLNRLLDLFPREQLLLLQSDHLRTDPNGVLTDVARFLDAPPPPKVEPRSVHVGQEMAGLEPGDVAYLRSLYAHDQARLRDLTGIHFSGA